ncbi:MAG TPA: class I SAM-dependent methyltransferase [Candidatus Paceibacterota bacterium]
MRVTDPAFQEKLTVTPRLLNGKFFALDQKEVDNYDVSNEKGINILKNFLKRFPGFYEFLHVFVSPGFSCNRHYTAKKAVRFFYGTEDLKDVCVLNLGSGIKRIHPEIVQVDIYPLGEVDLVADARALPFKDGTVDMVICETVLEHVGNAQEVIKEIKRVLKPGGYIYISVPFVYPFHASPDDFHRWSIPGLKMEFEGFSVAKSGMCAGPAAALQAMLMHFCALPLSFGSYVLYHAWSIFFMFLFAPLKLFDFLWGEIPNASDIGSIVYIMAAKGNL